MDYYGKHVTFSSYELISLSLVMNDLWKNMGRVQCICTGCLAPPLVSVSLPLLPITHGR